MIRHLISMVALLALVASARATDQVVTDSGDNGGANQLRAKLNDLQSSGGGSLTFGIGFATVVLTQGVLPNITTNCTIDGGDAVTISGNDVTRVFFVNPGATLTLNHVTISHGFINADGGAIRNEGILNLNNSKLTSNQTTAAFSGGAIVSVGKLNVTNSEFANNKAGNGGAIYPRFSASMTNITASNFHDNVTSNTTNGWGGAMLLWDGAPVTIDRSTFSNNLAAQGGALYVFANSSLTMTNGTLSGNSVTGITGATAIPTCPMSSGAPPGAGNLGGGGGIYNAGTTSLINCTLSGNAATGGLGGYGGNALACGSADGTASDGGRGGLGEGGGIFNAAVVTLSNCTLNGNSAKGGTGGTGGFDTFNNHNGGTGGEGMGGGIYNNGTLTPGNCTLSANSALAGNGGTGTGGPGSTGSLGTASGGGIVQDASGSSNLRNDLIAGNSAFRSSPDVQGTFTSQGHSLIGKKDGSSGLTNGTNNDLAGTVAAPLDPMLGGLQSNGGPTFTMALQSGSPAIDAGTASGAPTRDQRNYVRSNTPDIGAFEFGGAIPVTLANIATRLFVQTGDNVLIGGFIITGTQDKKVILRAIGPSLSLPGKLTDPTLELYQGNTLLESNDNWMDSSTKQAIIDSTIPPSDPLEAAIVRSLAPGGYTAIVRGANNATGIGVIEAYDLDRTVDSKLANIATRGAVQTGDNVLFAGFIVLGPDSQNVIIRALGPSVPAPGVMSDPTLDLYDSNGAILESNDNWVDSPNKQAIIDSTIPPSNNMESAIVRTLLPANYTAIVRGVDNTTGIAVVEVYALQ